VIELLVEALPARVGSPLSVKNLREELEVAQETAERWLKMDTDGREVDFVVLRGGKPSLQWR
jgi:hypothetical protein